MIITTSCSAWHVFYYLTRDLTRDIESSDKELDTGKSQSAFKRRRRRRREGEKNRILTRPTVWPKVVMSEYRGFRPALGILGEYDNGSLLFFFSLFFQIISLLIYGSKRGGNLFAAVLARYSLGYPKVRIKVSQSTLNSNVSLLRDSTCCSYHHHFFCSPLTLKCCLSMLRN